MRRVLFLLFFWGPAAMAQRTAAAAGSFGQPMRWNLAGDGGISWMVRDGDTAHTDHIEMAGKGIAAIVTYGVDAQGAFVLRQHLVFPGLRTLPNDTRGSYFVNLAEDVADSILVDGQPIVERPAGFYIRGLLRVVSHTGTPLVLERTIFPSVDKRAYIERYVLTNTGTAAMRVRIPVVARDSVTDGRREVAGPFVVERRTYDGGDIVLGPGNSSSFAYVVAVRRRCEEAYVYAASYELRRREAMVNDIFASLVLRTPNDTVDRLFDFAKLRAAESIYDTKAGLMHSPGGGDYYAAIWANDQAEYASPFFPFLGNIAGNEAAENTFRLFGAYMNKAFRPIPSSIVAEGDSTWDGAGDRGDQAMIAYGAARFALAYGDTIEARRLWPLISWCLDYLRRRRTEQGVIASDADELEGRFPAGKVNLSTNVLAYGGFLYASRVAASLGDAVTAAGLRSEAARLREDLGKYFAARVSGYDTYRYYDGNTILRSWICLPLVMGIFDRAPQTIKALLSPYLWTRNGILTEAGDTTFWDRATLYAFRGLFYAGATDTCYRYFAYYSRTRLLGEHVPYPVEAWPEGNQRQLSAESALYCRAITEGLFGIDPLGLQRFSLRPRLPAGWPFMTLEHMRAFGGDWGISVRGKRVTVTRNGRLVKEVIWDGVGPIVIDRALVSDGTSAAAGEPDGVAVATGVQFGGSDTALVRAFAWAKAEALHYRGKPGDPVGPWYESALPPRDAFCMRDVSHQCVGGAILGLDAENKNMLSLFARNISASKNWCSYWEMNKHGVPAPEDYRTDREFWYNLDANFDVLSATWRLAAWTGDSSYYRDAVFQLFQRRTAGDYIGSWVLQPDSLLTRPAHPNAPMPFHEQDAFDRCRGLPSYSEGIPNMKMGVDLVAALYRGMRTYADILRQRGEPTRALDFARRAERYRARLEADWWSDSLRRYHTWYSTDGHFGLGEGETFLLWFDALRDTARIRRTIDHLASVRWNMENTSYLPYLFYREGYWDTARRTLLYCADPGTARREYPEVSFGVVQGVVLGLMGVEPVPGTRVVQTLYRHRGDDSAQISDLPILGTTLTVRHVSPASTTAANTGERAVVWRAEFSGAFELARVTRSVRAGAGQEGVTTMAMRQVRDKWGRMISSVDVPLKPGARVSVDAVEVLRLPGGRVDVWPDSAAQREIYISNATEDDTLSKVKHVAIWLENRHHLIVEGNHTLLVLHGKMVSFALLHCSDVTIRNLSVDYARPTMSEMTVGSIGPHVAEVRVHPDSRYRIDDSGRIHFYGEGWEARNLFAIAYDPGDGSMRYVSVERLFASRAKAVSGRLVRFEGDFSTTGLHAGEVLTVRDPYRDNVGAFIDESRDVVLDHVNMYYMHGLGIVSQYSENLRFTAVRIAPRPGSGRIVSAFADCFHFSGCRGSIVLDSCLTSGSHDDAVNVHGIHLRIVGRRDAKTLRVRFMHPQTWGFPAFYPGDSIAYVDPQTLLPIGYGVVLNARMIDRREIELGLASAPPDPMPVDACVENITWTPEVTIRHCRFERTNTRGVLVTTRRKVLIEDNTFYHTGMQAVLIADDALSWFESGPVRDVMIRGNRFVGCGYNLTPDDYVIAIAPENRKTVAGEFVHHNIRIENNTFETSDGLLLSAKSVDGLSFLQNRVVALGGRKRVGVRDGQNRAAVPDGPKRPAFRVIDCANVRLQEML